MAKPWADRPFPLITTPKANLGGKPQSGACRFATEMAIIHNMFIRGMNSMTNQAPHVKETKDVKDFMLYAKTWILILHQHHATEEEMAFPLLETETGVKGIMDVNVVQHEEFTPGVNKFSEYVNAVLEDRVVYNDYEVVKLIANFGTLLTTHLNNEIDTILDLEKYAIDWESCNKGITDHALKKLDKNIDIGWVMTHMDFTFEGGIHRDEWIFPWYLSIFFRWVYVPKHTEMWRFSPCDSYCKPKQLPFA